MNTSEKNSMRLTIPTDLYESLGEIAKKIHPNLGVKSLVIQACVEFLERKNTFTVSATGASISEEKKEQSSPEIASAFAELEGFLDS